MAMCPKAGCDKWVFVRRLPSLGFKCECGATFSKKILQTAGIETGGGGRTAGPKQNGAGGSGQAAMQRAKALPLDGVHVGSRRLEWWEYPL